MHNPDMARRRGYFLDPMGMSAFNEAFVQALAEIQKGIVAQYIPPENVQRFRHGNSWSTPGTPDLAGGEMQTHSAVLETPFGDLVDNDLSAIPRSFQHLSQSMHGQFAQMLYSTVSDSCDQSGNTIDARDHVSLPEAFLAMLEKIEFAADKDGAVSLPEIHVGPDLVERPAETTSVLFKAAALLDLKDVFDRDLWELDGHGFSAFLPGNSAHFGADCMEGGLNLVWTVGLDVFRVEDFIASWPTDAPSLGDEGARAGAVLASLLYPDRVAWFLFDSIESGAA